jgi:excisionase family DNA binding protein
MSAKEEISPEQASEMLRISLRTLLKKIDAGEIASHSAGSQRVIAIADVLAYRSVQRERAQSALRRMRDEADEMGLYV